LLVPIQWLGVEPVIKVEYLASFQVSIVTLLERACKLSWVGYFVVNFLMINMKVKLPIGFVLYECAFAK